MCTITTSQDSNIPAAAGYTKTGSTNIDTSVGIALNGVLLFNGVSADKVDPFYPKAWASSSVTTAEKVDMCLAHPQVQGYFHYHMMPPCIYETSLATTPGPCDGISLCKSDIR